MVGYRHASEDAAAEAVGAVTPVQTETGDADPMGAIDQAGLGAPSQLVLLTLRICHVDASGMTYNGNRRIALLTRVGDESCSWA